MQYAALNPLTGSYDGRYSNREDAKSIAGFLSVKWSGSQWIIIPCTGVQFNKCKFHLNNEEELISYFGDPDYAACDKYDNQ